MTIQVTPVKPNRVSSLTTSLSMTNIATETVMCLHNMTLSYKHLMKSLRTRRDMVKELNAKLKRCQEHGTEPTSEQYQVQAELYFLEACIVRSDAELAAIQQRVDEIKDAI